MEQSIKIIEETKKVTIEKIKNTLNVEVKITLINQMKELDISLNKYKTIILKKVNI